MFLAPKATECLLSHQHVSEIMRKTMQRLGLFLNAMNTASCRLPIIVYWCADNVMRWFLVALVIQCYCNRAFVLFNLEQKKRLPVFHDELYCASYDQPMRLRPKIHTFRPTESLHLSSFADSEEFILWIGHSWYVFFPLVSHTHRHLQSTTSRAEARPNSKGSFRGLWYLHWG